MNKTLKKIFNDIFLIYIIAGIVCLTGIKYGKSLISEEFSWFSLGCVSAIYIFKCFKHRNLDRNTDYGKVVLIVREVVLAVAEVILYALFLSIWPDNYFQLPDVVDELLFSLILYFIIYKLLLSFLAIALGIKLLTMVSLFFMFIPIAILVGGFDIKYWAAVTGILGIWNYVNSRDFIVYLRKGKPVSDIPKELEYKWQRNKLFANLGTVIFYCSLVISSFFEKDGMLWMDRIKPRLFSLAGLTVFLVLIFLLVFVRIIMLKNQGKKNFFMRLDKLE